MKIAKVAAVFAAMLVAGGVFAATITNRGEVIEVTLMSDQAEGSTTVVKDQSVWPTGTDRRGIYILTVDLGTTTVTAAGASDVVTWTVPQGTIFEEDAVIEVATATSPTYLTNSLAVGGVTLYSGTGLGAAGVVDVDAGPAITTSEDTIELTLGGDASNGVFTVYLPFVLGNAQ